MSADLLGAEDMGLQRGDLLLYGRKTDRFTVPRQRDVQLPVALFDAVGAPLDPVQHILIQLVGFGLGGFAGFPGGGDFGGVVTDGAGRCGVGGVAGVLNAGVRQRVSGGLAGGSQLLGQRVQLLEQVVYAGALEEFCLAGDLFDVGTLALTVAATQLYLVDDAVHKAAQGRHLIVVPHGDEVFIAGFGFVITYHVYRPFFCRQALFRLFLIVWYHGKPSSPMTWEIKTSLTSRHR